MNRTKIAAPAFIAALAALAISFNPLPTEATSSIANAASPQTATAIFAGGCFWCVETDFDHVAGVVETISGYMGGTSENATYKSHTQFGHREVVQIKYDPSITNFETLLTAFFRSVDPTDAGGQFCDRGFSYTTAIYVTDEDQRTAAEAAKQAASKALGKTIATEIVDAAPFWAAETYHQDYYMKNPVRYKGYRYACGRDKRVDALWGDEARFGQSEH